MKTIKEEAEEHSKQYRCVIREIVYGSYTAGANYVLEQLEEFLNLYGVCCMTSSGRTFLKDMIEQLKK